MKLLQTIGKDTLKTFRTQQGVALKLFQASMPMNILLPKLSDSFEKTLLYKGIVIELNHLISVIPACRESFLTLLKQRRIPNKSE